MLHIRSAYNGHPMLDGKIQNLLLKEYSRLRSSERSLLFFISTVSQMTGAERDLVRLLLDGKKLKEIAAIRCVEVVTVKTQVKSLLRKLAAPAPKKSWISFVNSMWPTFSEAGQERNTSYGLLSDPRPGPGQKRQDPRLPSGGLRGGLL